MLYWVQGSCIFGLLDRKKKVAFQPLARLSSIHWNLGDKDVFEMYKDTHIRNYKTAIPPQFILGGTT